MGDCGCVWERQEGFGDVIIIQCAKHAVQTSKTKAAMRAADAAVERLRQQRRKAK